MEYNNNLYQSNLLRLLTQNDLTEINNSIDNVINTEIPQQINNSVIYATSSSSAPSFNIDKNIRFVICCVTLSKYATITMLLCEDMNAYNATTTSNTKTDRLRGAELVRVFYSLENKSFKITRIADIDNSRDIDIDRTNAVFFT